MKKRQLKLIPPSKKRWILSGLRSDQMGPQVFYSVSEALSYTQALGITLFHLESVELSKRRMSYLN